MDDGHIPPENPTGHDIGPGEENGYAFPQEVSMGSPHLIEMVRNVSDVSEGDIEYELVQVNRPVFSEPLDMTLDASSEKRTVDPQFYSEHLRLGTFRNKWKQDFPVKPEDLARNGFIYMGPGDVVLCVFCLKTLRQWDVGDDVEREHRRNYPLCPFVRGQCDNLNIPLNSAHSLKMAMGVKVKNGCAYPDMSEASARMQTFATWPFEMTVSAKKLVNAGLFFTGQRDAVKCFSCGKILRGWEIGDDPLTEHHKFYPQCSFVKALMRAQSTPISPICTQESPMEDMEPHYHKTEPSCSNQVAETGSQESNSRAYVREFESSIQEISQETERLKLTTAVQVTQEGFDAEMELSSLSAQAILQNQFATREELIPVLQALRQEKGPDVPIQGSEIMERLYRLQDMMRP